MLGIPCWILSKKGKRQECGSGVSYISALPLKIDSCLVIIAVDWPGGFSRSARQYFRALNRFSRILGGASVKPARIRSSPTQCSGTRQAADRVVLRWPLWENLTDTHACHGGI